MTSINQTPQCFKVNILYGHLWLVVDGEGKRWTPLGHLSDIIGISMNVISSKMERGDRYWGSVNFSLPYGVSGKCLLVDRVSELIRSIRESQVQKANWPRLGWLKANAQASLTGFRIPQPQAPMIQEEPVACPVTRFPEPTKIPAPVVTASELIPVMPATIGGEQINAVDGRGLHTFLEVGKVFAAWMPEQIEAFGFQEHRDFEITEGLSFPNSESAKARPQKTKEYMVSLSMAKELAMVQRNEKGKQARLYFIECERRAVAAVHHPSLPDFTNPAIAARAWAEQFEGRAALACKVESQQAEISEMRPQAEGLKRLAVCTKGAKTLTESAKLLQQPPRKFITRLQAEEWLYRQNGNLTAYQPKIHQGLMEHKFVTIKREDGPEMHVSQPLITPKGLAKLAEMFGSAA